MQRLLGLLTITVAVVIVALAVNTLARNTPLDREWALFLGGLVAVIVARPEIRQRQQEQAEARRLSEAPDAEQQSEAVSESD